MAHYFESGFFVREKAWHGLGTVLREAPRDTREALRLAGLDWHVNLQPVFARCGDDTHDGNIIECEDNRAMVRDVHQRDGSIRSDVLGIVGTRYEPLQNVDAFRWFDPLVAEGNVKLEAAGSVKGGRHVWILARIDDAPVQVGTRSDDIVNPYLLLSNSHDGTRAVTVTFTPIRVVCWNTLSAANRAADRPGANARKVRHTRAAVNTLAGIRDTIDLARRDFSAKALLWRELASYTLPLGQARARTVANYTRAVFGKPGEEDKEIRAEKHVWQLLHNGPGADSAGATAFGLYMAATHYSDHENGHTAATRLASTWFGAASNVRERAETEAMKLAGIA